ncbi:hypothetical protein SEA_Maroc7_74 [Mycobacterium phage Maroc7]|nr:hypothetical protein SEA_Maroc7_74 [Mycobacterium phage Maroc7]
MSDDEFEVSKEHLDAEIARLEVSKKFVKLIDELRASGLSEAEIEKLVTDKSRSELRFKGEA